MTKRGYRTILIVRRGKLVPFEVDVRGLDEEQIALGLDDELHAEMQRRRSGGRSYTLDQACEILGIPSPTPHRRASKPNASRPVR